MYGLLNASSQRLDTFGGGEDDHEEGIEHDSMVEQGDAARDPKNDNSLIWRMELGELRDKVC